MNTITVVLLILSIINSPDIVSVACDTRWSDVNHEPLDVVPTEFTTGYKLELSSDIDKCTCTYQGTPPILTCVCQSGGYHLQVHSGGHYVVEQSTHPGFVALGDGTGRTGPGQFVADDNLVHLMHNIVQSPPVPVSPISPLPEVVNSVVISNTHVSTHANLTISTIAVIVLVLAIIATVKRTAIAR